MAALSVLALSCAVAAASALASEAAACAELPGEASSFVQVAALRSFRNESFAAERAPQFDEHTAALSRMLYGFYMLASCPSLMTSTQQSGSRCRHCEAAGFDFTPGDLRVIHVNENAKAEDTSAVVARLRPRPSDPDRKGGCVLAIRGTQTMGNIVGDLAIAQRPMPGCEGCKVHGGWLQKWSVLKPQVLEKIAELGCGGPEQALYVTGHSSGCATIDYAAFDLHAAGHTIATSIGYNCPKPGDANFARAFDETFPSGVWKVQVERDPIKHMPPQWTGYRSVGWAAQYLHSDDGYHVCGKGDAVCEGDHPPSLFDLPGLVTKFHCAAPHRNSWSEDVYMRCDAKCDTTLLEPEWELLPEARVAGAAMFAQRPEGL